MDLFGDNTPGYSPLNVPWDVSVGLSYRYSQQYSRSDIVRQINLRASLRFSLTPTWSIDANARYDFVRGELLTPVVNLRKELHCWMLTATWNPSGYNRGFYLKFAVKAPHLNDLKIEKRSNRLY